MKQIVKWAAEGAVKWALDQSILQREGIRKLPGVCWYPAKRVEVSMNRGGTADK